MRGLRKAYGDVEAVAGIDLEIRRGEVFARLGPNGAGKTTTVEILEGYRRRTAGEVLVLSEDPESGSRELRQRIGIVLGALCFTALGFTVASFVRRAETAPIVANLTLFPLLFISGVFYSVEGAPAWALRIAKVFPLYHLVHAFTACFSPFTTGSGFSARDLASLVAWGAIGTFVAVRRFSREATDEEGGAARRSWR